MASRFLDRAVLYRIHRGIREKDTPMAVLFMPMVEPRASGVIFTRDPADMEADLMLVSAVEGLGSRVVRGTVKADTFRLTRGPDPRLVEARPASGKGGKDWRPDYLAEEELLLVGALAWRVREEMGYDVDMEWAVDREGGIRFLQARRVAFHGCAERMRGGSSREIALVEGGITIFPGRAEGYVFRLGPGEDPGAVPPASVVVVDQPGPELVPLLPRAAALLAAEGNPVGHLATLAREFAVPSIFQLGRAVERLEPGRVVSVDATARAVYDGSRWPGIHERVLARVRAGGRPPRSGTLHDLILALNLTDPDAAGFKASRCRSIHDALRFMHEMSIRAMFTFGDRWRKEGGGRGRRLDARLPVRFFVIGLDREAVPDKKNVAPEEIESVPFRAFWRGFSDPKLPWPDRWRREMMGLPRDFRETVLGGRVVERLLYEDPATGEKATTADEIGFYKAQERIALAQNGVIDPTSIEDYIEAGGYGALAKALSSMTPDEVLSEVERSGLRGRGGGGEVPGDVQHPAEYRHHVWFLASGSVHTHVIQQEDLPRGPVEVTFNARSACHPGGDILTLRTTPQTGAGYDVAATQLCQQVFRLNLLRGFESLAQVGTDSRPAMWGLALDLAHGCYDQCLREVELDPIPSP